MYEWVMSQIWMSHVSHLSLGVCAMCRIWISQVAHTWMRHVTRMDASCRTHMNESCQKYEEVMSHIQVSRAPICFGVWLSHVTHVNESHDTQEWVMLHTWMIHVAHLNESCHTHEWVMSPTIGDPLPDGSRYEGFFSTQVCVYAYMCAFASACVRVCGCVSVRVCIFIYIYVYICMYIHVWMCAYTCE